MPEGIQDRGGFAEGRSAASDELRFRLPGSGVDYLHGAVQNPHFGEEHLEHFFSNPALPAGLIQQVAARKVWLRRYEVQRAIVLHPNTPRPLKINLLHFLRWRDLTRVVEDVRCPPPVKRAAENLLRARIAVMALGEWIALARIASPGVIPSFHSDPHPEVIVALLGNGRLTEDEVVAICAGERTPAQVLSAVATAPRWGDRYSVKMALLRNTRTPAAASLRLLGSLLSTDLTEIVASPVAPRLVRATARKILQARGGSVDTDTTVS